LAYSHLTFKAPFICYFDYIKTLDNVQ